MFVHPSEPVRFALLTLENRGNTPRRLSLFAYSEWALGPPRAGDALHTITELDPEIGAVLARWRELWLSHAVANLSVGVRGVLMKRVLVGSVALVALAVSAGARAADLVPAMPVKPSKPAIRPITRKIRAHLSMGRSIFPNATRDTTPNRSLEFRGIFKAITAPAVSRA